MDDVDLSLGVRLGPEIREFVAGVIRHHSGTTRSPARGANLTMLISVLEGLDHAEDLIDVATDRQVIHAKLTKDAIGINDVSGTHGDTLIIGVLKEAAVVASNALSNVRNHGHVHWAKTTLLPRLHCVLSMSKLRVDRAADQLAVNRFELR